MRYKSQRRRLESQRPELIAMYDRALGLADEALLASIETNKWTIEFVRVHATKEEPLTKLIADLSKRQAKTKLALAAINETKGTP